MAGHRQAFARSIARVRGLLALHETLHGKPGRPPQHVSDILRGALVLAFAALDAVVSDAVAGRLPHAIRRSEVGDTVTRWVKDAPDRVLACFAGDAGDCMAHLVAAFTEDVLRRRSFQRPDAIEKVVQDVCQLRVDWSAIDREANAIRERRCRRRRKKASGSRPDGDRVRRELARLVERRHSIAHDGDVTSGGYARTISLKYVTRAVDLIEATGLHICDLMDVRAKPACAGPEGVAETQA